jgi:hypothetical protein
VLRFLEVDEDFPIEVLKINPTVRTRSQQLEDVVHAVSVGRGRVSSSVRALLKGLTPQTPRRGLQRFVIRRLVFGKPKPPDEELMKELRIRFKDEVAALSEYLDRDLITLWGYDGIA